MSRTLRIGIIAVLHESNTFLSEPTTIEHFECNVLACGSEVLQTFRGSQHEVGGFISAVEPRPDVTLVGVFAARAMPFGAIRTSCWIELMSRLDEALLAAGPFDGLLVAPHGATVAECAPDADGDWLARVRDRVGPDVPIVGTLDLHANVSPLMVAQCTALFGYRTNPHLDQFARGVEAGRTLLGILDGMLRPQMKLVQLPLCVNIDRQATEESHGIELRAEADRLEKRPGMLSVSCLYGFPYADVPEMGASVIAISDSESHLALDSALDMARFWWARREQFRGQLIDIDDALKLAADVRLENSSQPVGLLDMGDNVGGGSPGDGTSIIHRWLASGLRKSGRLLAVLADESAVEESVCAGIGGEVALFVGGRMDPVRHGMPVHDLFRVVSMSNGRFVEPQARHGGYTQFDQGPTAVLEGSSGLTAIVTTLRVAPMSLQQIVSQGVRPEDFAAIVIKGAHAPVAAYRSVCSRLIRVNTDGVTTADLTRLAFRNRRGPMEPFESFPDWQP